MGTIILIMCVIIVIAIIINALTLCYRKDMNPGSAVIGGACLVIILAYLSAGIMTNTLIIICGGGLAGIVLLSTITAKHQNVLVGGIPIFLFLGLIGWAVLTSIFAICGVMYKTTHLGMPGEVIGEFLKIAWKITWGVGVLIISYKILIILGGIVLILLAVILTGEYRVLEGIWPLKKERWTPDEPTRPRRIRRPRRPGP